MRAPAVEVPLVPCVTDPTPCPEQSPWVTHCSFTDPAPPSQRWTFARSDSGHWLLSQGSTGKCLARTDGAAVRIEACNGSSGDQAWNFGAANLTVAQIRDAADASSCLTFNASSLHMAPCSKEAGDKTTPNPTGCRDGNCRFSSIIYQVSHFTGTPTQRGSLGADPRSHCSCGT